LGCGLMVAFFALNLAAAWPVRWVVLGSTLVLAGYCWRRRQDWGRHVRPLQEFWEMLVADLVLLVTFATTSSRLGAVWWWLWTFCETGVGIIWALAILLGAMQLHDRRRAK